MRFRAFNSRYRLLAPFHLLKRMEDKAIEDCKVCDIWVQLANVLELTIVLQFQLILDCFIQTQKNIQPISAASTTWALGKRHIFLSEGVRQQLEMLRSEKRMLSATLIQSTWRGYYLRRRWSIIKKSLIASNTRNVSTQNGMSAKPRPVPITGTPPPFNTTQQQQQQNQTKSIEMCDQNVIQETCTLFGIDLVYIYPFLPLIAVQSSPILETLISNYQPC